MRPRDPVSVSDTLCCFRFDSKKTYSFSKTCCFAPPHRITHLACHELAEGEVRYLIPTEPRVTHRWHCSGFSAWGCPHPRTAALGLGEEAQRAVRNTREVPSTLPILQLGRGSPGAYPTHSGHLFQTRSRAVGTGRRRSR